MGVLINLTGGLCYMLMIPTHPLKVGHQNKYNKQFNINKYI